MVKKISDFLAKFTQLAHESTWAQECAAQAVKDITGIEVLRKHIEIKGRTIFITASPAEKNMIYMHQKEILDRTAKQNPRSTAEKIL